MAKKEEKLGATMLQIVSLLKRHETTLKRQIRKEMIESGDFVYFAAYEVSESAHAATMKEYEEYISANGVEKEKQQIFVQEVMWAIFPTHAGDGALAIPEDKRELFKKIEHLAKTILGVELPNRFKRQ